MDNASKALLIAGEMLIAVLVVGIIASTVSKFGSFSANMNQKMDKNKQEEFNNHFFEFEGRIDITAAEIVGIANYAKENNDKSELFLTNGHTQNINSPDYVDVIVDGNYLFASNTEIDYKNRIREFLKQNNEKLYSCNAEIRGFEDVNDHTNPANPILLYKKILRISKDKKQIVQTEEDNGRKGYVKAIKFEHTVLPPPENEDLTIYNINNYNINY